MRHLLVLLFFLHVYHAEAQYTKHIIQLTDKNNSPYSLSNPSGFLSLKSIERRARQQITLDSTDLPVNPAYVQRILEAGDITLLNTSRWLNQVLIETTDTAALNKISNFSFVKTVNRAARKRKQRTRDNIIYESKPVRKQKRVQETGNYFSYGSNFDQVNIHEGEFLHNQGFRGEGMTIAVLDAGFYRYDTNPAFDSIRLGNQVLGTWDFVLNKSSITEEHYHGLVCFSTIAANSPGKMVGTAPKAYYYLFRTEDVSSEYQVEEQNWVAAAEKADSLGVDIITSSLGYYEFDDASRNYTYEDMDGKTAIITRGAEAAFKKGMIVTNSAGNSGQEDWHYIVAPADGPHVLAVGSVDVNKSVSPFSSYGPSADGRIKPDVASVGWGTVVTGIDGKLAYMSGTSLANPNLAGLITCLWQAFPQLTNTDIIDAVKRSADRYHNPDDRTGYGIPNMRIAYELLAEKVVDKNTRTLLGNDWIKAYPVPFTSALTVLIKPRHTGTAILSLLNNAGKEVLVKKINVTEGITRYEQLPQVTGLGHGIYWLRYHEGKYMRVLKLVK